MFAGGLSVLLLGIHIELHIYRKSFSKITSIIVSVLILCGGIYGITNSNEIQWLSIPFSTMTQPNADNKENNSHQSKPNENKSNNITKKNNSEIYNKNISKSSNLRKQEKNIKSTPITDKIKNVLMFLCMILSASVIIYWIIKLKNHIKKRKKYFIINMDTHSFF